MEPKRPIRKTISTAKRRQERINAMLADVPGYRRRTENKQIVLGVANNHVVLCCPACSKANLHRSDVVSGPDRLILTFWCEGCDKQPELTIEQYKAQTRLIWHY